MPKNDTICCIDSIWQLCYNCTIKHRTVTRKNYVGFGLKLKIICIIILDTVYLGEYNGKK